MPVHTVHLRLPFNARALHTCAQRAMARRRALYQSRARCWPSPLSGQWHWQTPTRRISFTLPGFGSQNRHGRRPGCAHGGQRHSERGRLLNHALRQPGPRSESSSTGATTDERKCGSDTESGPRERALAASRGQVAESESPSHCSSACIRSGTTPPRLGRWIKRRARVAAAADSEPASARGTGMKSRFRVI